MSKEKTNNNRPKGIKMRNREYEKISGLTFETQLVEENGVEVEIPTAVFIQSSNISKCIDYMKEHGLKCLLRD